MKKLVGLAGMLVLACLFQGCGRNTGYVPENAKYDKSFTAMDTYMTFAAYGKNAENGLEDASRRVQEIENICSVTREGSEIYGVNHRTENTVSLGKESAKLLREAMTISERSGGAFDVTMYPVLQLWGFTDGKYQVPGEEALKEALNEIGVMGITVTQVLGCGVQKGGPKLYRGVEVEVKLLPKVKVEVIVSAVPVEKVIETARKVLYTGNIGDGKIFLYNVEDVIKVRTGETGYDALQGVED